MKCYYEEIGVLRDASESDIKSAYRKLALRWHPDKNPDCADEAKERFQLIQQAYEVLSDPQERAWYDNHREQILRGKNSNYEDNCLDVFQYFTVSCFKGFNDDKNGFYAVYREVFKKISTEDADFISDEEDLEEIPEFGDSKSNYEEVVGPFYAYWQSYCTKRTYTWLCPYDITDIKDRRILRGIEKNMKKIVQKARSERNEEVRNLVSFIRKRDKRVQAYKVQLEERAAQNRQKQEQIRQDQIRKRQKDLEEARQNCSLFANHDYEEQLKQLEQQYGSDYSGEEEDDEDEILDEYETDNSSAEEQKDLEIYEDLYCVACNKLFKNERAYSNHEASKKHRENVDRLGREMIAEEQTFNNSSDHIEDNEIDAENEAAYLSVNSEEVDETHTSNLKKKNKKSKKNKKLHDGFISMENSNENITSLTDEDLQLDDEEICNREQLFKPGNIDTGSEIHIQDSKSRKGKNKKSKKRQTVIVEDEVENVSKSLEDLEIIKDTKDRTDWNNTNKRDTRKGKNKSNTKPSATKNDKEHANNSPDSPIDQEIPIPISALANETSEISSNSQVHICVTCKSNFPSKNKLFNHLKLTNHGVYIPKPKTSATDEKRRGKGKKNKS